MLLLLLLLVLSPLPLSPSSSSSLRVSSEAYGFAVGIDEDPEAVLDGTFASPAAAEVDEVADPIPVPPPPPLPLFAGVFVDGAVVGVEVDGPAVVGARAGGAMGPKGEDP